MNFTQKYRPTRLRDVVGQPVAVRTLTAMLEAGRLPPILLIGPKGIGKTTIAGIIKASLGCHDADFHRHDAAGYSGVATAREIRARIGLAPIGGPCRLYFLDEIHTASRAFQSVLLSVLNDPPAHVRFILATTAPKQLLSTLRDRCAVIRLNSIGADDLGILLERVVAGENIVLHDRVRRRLIRIARGSARRLLIKLEMIAPLASPREQQAALGIRRPATNGGKR
jgi:DNA polymerase-3 subunit gamma/tau